MEFLPRFSAALAASCPNGQGPRVWIKRDDLLGLSPGGNKTRKLEFMVADALAQDADTLITCGAPQSNHCRTTLAAAVKEGLRCRLVIEERLPNSFREDAGGNQFLFRLLGVEKIRVVSAGAPLATLMEEELADLVAQGRKGYIVAPGGTCALGGLGYVDCVQELQQQFQEQSVRVDQLVVASGSAGTHASLLVGLAALGLDIPVIGICVSRGPQLQHGMVWRDVQEVATLLGDGLNVAETTVECVDGYWQPKYSVPNPMMVEAVHLLARTEAILLDPVYTGKALAGLIGLARQGRFHPHQNVLFIHTGGLPVLPLYAPVLLGTSSPA